MSRFADSKEHPYMHLSDTIQRLAESATLAMARKSRELREQGVDVISLSLGEPDFNTPDSIKEAGIQAIKDNFSSYPPVNGYLDVRQAISRKFKRDNNLDYSPDQIVVSTGAKQSIANVVMAIVSEGEEVLIPAPYWVSYEEIIKLAGGVPVSIPCGLEQDFKLTPEQLREHISDNTRMMIFSTPCNPTGSFYTKDELAGLADVIKKHPEFYVVCDEIYEHINFVGGHASLASFPEVYDQVITINGVSKAFAMTGWRIGYMGAAEWIAKACSKIQGQITSGANGMSQKAAGAAVSQDPSITEGMRKEFLARRDLVLSRLSAIQGLQCNVPQGAFYIFPDVSSFIGKSSDGYHIASTADLVEYLLVKHHLALVQGEAFGAPGFIRISYAASREDLMTAMDRLEQGLNALQ